MPTSRRNFLYLLLGSSIGAFFYPTISLPGSTDAGKPATLATALADFPGDKASARIVGVEYLRHYPAECDAVWLVDQILLDDIVHRTEFLKLGGAERKEMITRLIREDFKCGRIVQVRGWMLSQTEARLCAISALT